MDSLLEDSSSQDVFMCLDVLEPNVPKESLANYLCHGALKQNIKNQGTQIVKIMHAKSISLFQKLEDLEFVRSFILEFGHIRPSVSMPRHMQYL